MRREKDEVDKKLWLAFLISIYLMNKIINLDRDISKYNGFPFSKRLLFSIVSKKFFCFASVFLMIFLICMS